MSELGCCINGVRRAGGVSLLRAFLWNCGNQCIDARQRDIHRSQNRVESYHQLRMAIAAAYGKSNYQAGENVKLRLAINAPGLLPMRLFIIIRRSYLSSN